MIALAEYEKEKNFDLQTVIKMIMLKNINNEGTDKSEGYVDDKRVFSFTVPLSFSPEIFKQSSHNVIFFSPSRRNVSDSYRAVQDFFTGSFDDTNEEEK